MSTGQRPALVLLHGAVLNGAMWGPIAAELADFEVAAPDLPGHGARAREPFRLATAVAAVREAVDVVASPKLLLAGDSLGGYVSIAAADRLGDRLAGMVLCGSTANFQSLVFLLYQAEIALTGLFPARVLETRLSARVGREYQAGPAILEGGLRPQAFSQAVAELRRFDIAERLRDIEVPVLFVNGSKDRRHRLGERRALAATRHASFRLIEGAGHGVTLTHPAEIATLIRAFATGIQQRQDATLA